MRLVTPEKLLAPRHWGWNKWRLTFPLVYCCIALVFISWKDMQRDLWTDEAFTASYTAHNTVSEVLEDVRKNEETPPLYFVLIWAWTKLIGDSEFSLRSFSLACGLLSVGMFSLLARSWLREAQAHLAAFVFATAPLLSTYMVEARGYTLTLLLSLCCIITFEKIYGQTPSIAAWAGYAVSSACLLLTSYFGIVLIIAHNFVWGFRIWMKRSYHVRDICPWLVVQLCVGSIMLLWFPQLIYQVQIGRVVTSTWTTSGLDYFWLIFSVLMGPRPQSVPAFIGWMIVAGLTTELILLSLVRAQQPYQSRLLRVVGVPALVLIGLILWSKATEVRYFMVLLPGAAFGVAIGWTTLSQRRPWIRPLLAGLIVMGIVGYKVPKVFQPEPPKAWPEITRQFEHQVDPSRDIVLFHPPWGQRIFEYYYMGPQVQLIGAHNYDDFYVYQEHHLRTTWTSKEAVEETRNGDRIWIFFDQTTHQVPKLSLPYTLRQHTKAGNLELFLYENESN